MRCLIREVIEEEKKDPCDSRAQGGADDAMWCGRIDHWRHHWDEVIDD